MDALWLWKHLSEERRQRAAAAFYADQGLKEFHRAADAFIARLKNFRPQFLRKLPPENRSSYLAHLPLTPDLVSQLLVSYHFAEHRPMMQDFLDALSIPNREGLIHDDFDLSAPSEDALLQAETVIRGKYPATDADLYLATLRLQNPEVWGGLKSPLLEETVPAR